MTPTMITAIEKDDTFLNLFCTLFCLTLAFFLGGLATPFFGFHVWLTLMGMTTIEFCEKRLPKQGESSRSRGIIADMFVSDSMWDLGPFGNTQVALGRNPLFWFIPLFGPSGDGLSFPPPPPARGLESGR